MGFSPYKFVTAVLPGTTGFRLFRIHIDPYAEIIRAEVGADTLVSVLTTVFDDGSTILISKVFMNETQMRLSVLTNVIEEGDGPPSGDIVILSPTTEVFALTSMRLIRLVVDVGTWSAATKVHVMTHID